MPVQPARRPGRMLAVALLVAALALAGCQQVAATVKTTDALADAGVQDPIVTIETDAGVKTLTVRYHSRATTPLGLAVEQDRIAEIVWKTAKLDLGRLRVDQEGGPTGVRPSRAYSPSELADRFGPRPPELDDTGTSPWLATGAVLLVVVVVLALALAVGGVVWYMYFRRRQAAVPPWLAGSGYPGWDGYEPPPAGPGSPAPPAPPASYPAATPGHPGYPQARARARPAPEAGGAPEPESWPADEEGTGAAGPAGTAARGEGQRDDPDADPPLGGAWRRG
jgi:hypothetical protein